MGLPKGDDPKTIATNVKIAKNNLHLPHKAAVAVALRQAGKPKRAGNKQPTANKPASDSK